MPTARMIYQTPETREKILAVSQRLIMEKGLFSVQMTTIAAETGISRNSLYRYFRDKTDLAYTLMEIRLTELVTCYQTLRGKLSGTTSRDKVKDYFLRSWLNPKYRETQLFLAEFDAYFSGVRQVLDIRERLLKTFHVEKEDLLTELIRKGQQEGTIRSDIPPHLIMVTLVNTVRALHHRLLLRCESLLELQTDESEKMMETQLSILIDGIKGA